MARGLAKRAPEAEEVADTGGKPGPSQAELGRRVMERRQALELTRHQLAVASGVTTTTIFKIEKGTHSPKGTTLVAVARALQTSAEELVAP